MQIQPIYNENAIVVTGICGSLREESYTRLAVETALIGASQQGAQARLIDLRDYDLPFVDGREKEDYPEVVHQLKREVAGAQGIILGTPEYHGSYSGVLKNALDHMGFREFEGKVLGLIGVAEGGMGAVNALNHLRLVGRSLRAWVIPQQVSLPQVWGLYDDDGNLKSGHIEAHIIEVGRQVARFAALRRNEQFSEFIREWETAMNNPGAE
ncbi:MAG: NAD(P)H-dependent oxidoreductase [Chloroflexi bacterium]|nr:NAD(P)H-dependent oxidoreductase [Chloroflexota bacterium]